MISQTQTDKINKGEQGGGNGRGGEKQIEEEIVMMLNKTSNSCGINSNTKQHHTKYSKHSVS